MLVSDGAWTVISIYLGFPANSALNETQDYVRQFYQCHGNRQGIGVLGFRTNDAESLYQRYQAFRPHLIHSFREYPQTDGVTAKVLQAFAYNEGGEDATTGKSRDKSPDKGTLLRFVEVHPNRADSHCPLPGLTEVKASFDYTSQAAYCDHWVSNVYSRTDFWKTLEEVLDFTPKASKDGQSLSY